MLNMSAFCFSTTHANAVYFSPCYMCDKIKICLKELSLKRGYFITIQKIKMHRHSRVYSEKFAHKCDKNESTQSECFFCTVEKLGAQKSNCHTIKTNNIRRCKNQRVCTKIRICVWTKGVYK